MHTQISDYKSLLDLAYESLSSKADDQGQHITLSLHVLLDGFHYRWVESRGVGETGRGRQQDMRPYTLVDKGLISISIDKNTIVYSPDIEVHHKKDVRVILDKTASNLIIPIAQPGQQPIGAWNIESTRKNHFGESIDKPDSKIVEIFKDINPVTGLIVEHIRRNELDPIYQSNFQDLIKDLMRSDLSVKNAPALINRIIEVMRTDLLPIDIGFYVSNISEKKDDKHCFHKVSPIKKARLLLPEMNLSDDTLEQFDGQNSISGNDAIDVYYADENRDINILGYRWIIKPDVQCAIVLLYRLNPFWQQVNFLEKWKNYYQTLEKLTGICFEDRIFPLDQERELVDVIFDNSLTLGAMLEKLCEKLRGWNGWGGVNFYFYSKLKGLLYKTAYAGEMKQPDYSLMIFDKIDEHSSGEKYVTSRLIDRNTPYVDFEVHESLKNKHLTLPLYGYEKAAFYGVPLFHDGRQLGAITALQDISKGELGGFEKLFIKPVLNQLGFIISNALNKRLAIEKDKRIANLTKAGLDVSRALRRCKKVEDIWFVLDDVLSNKLGHRYFSLLLKKGDDLEISSISLKRLGRDSSDSKNKIVFTRKNSGLTGLLLQEDEVYEPFIEKTLGKSSAACIRFWEEITNRRKDRCYYGVSIKYKGDIEGAITFNGVRETGFHEEIFHKSFNHLSEILKEEIIKTLDNLKGVKNDVLGLTNESITATSRKYEGIIGSLLREKPLNKNVFLMIPMPQNPPDYLIQARRLINEKLNSAGYNILACDDKALIRDVNDVVERIRILMAASSYGIAFLGDIERSGNKSLKEIPNLNVMYELGWMHSTGRMCLLLKPKGVKVTTDISMFQWEEFDINHLSGLEKILDEWSGRIGGL